MFWYTLKKRNCIFKTIEYESVSRSLETNEIDVYYAGLNLCAQSLLEKYDKFIEPSGTKTGLAFEFGQILKKPVNLEESDFSSFLFENLNLLSYILIGYFLLFFFGFICFKKLFPFLNPLKKLKLISSKLLFNNHIQLRKLSPKFAYILLFFNLFLFILIQLLTNFIKTDKVTLNTDELIDTNEKILSNSKILYTRIENLRQFSHFPESSLLFKLVKRKKEQDQYLTKLNQTKIDEIIKKGQSSSILIFENRPMLLNFLLSFSMFTKNPIIFLKSGNYHQNIYVYFMRRRLDKNKKKFINQW